MSGWRETTLREAGVSLIDCDHRTPPASDSGYPYIAIPQLKQGRLELSDVRRITREHFLDWTRKAKPQPNDIVLSRRCNPGETAVVPAGLECALGQNLVLLRADDAKMFPPFLRWLVRGVGWWEQIGKFLNVGAVFDSLRCADIPNFRLPIPPISEQRAIASVLGALDDKIELNRRMNETLEAMARALFQNWFVDSTSNEFPKGWAVGPILNHARLLSGGTPKTEREDYWNGEILWASAKDVSQCGETFLVATDRTITQKGLEESATQLIPAFCTVVVARGATTGRMVMFGREMAMNQTCYGLASTTGTPFALYCQLRHEMDALVHTAHGSVFDTITTTTFANSKVILPPKPVLEDFERKVSPIFRRILASTEESRTLAALRDALLPKLLSGELRVPANLVSLHS